MLQRYYIKICMKAMSTQQAWQLNAADIEPDCFQVAGVYIMCHCERTLIFLALNNQSCRRAVPGFSTAQGSRNWQHQLIWQLC